MSAPRALAAGIAVVVAFVAGLWASHWLNQPGTHGQQSPTLLLTTPFTDLDGQRVQLDSWRGKPILVNFWATWCPPCLEEIPALIRLQARRPDIRIVGIALDQETNVREYRAKSGINYPIAVAGGEVAALLDELGNRAKILPFTVAVTPEGTLGRKHFGALSDADLVDLAGPPKAGPGG